MSIVKFNQDSPIQKIKASFLDDEIVLTPKQEEIKEQIRFAYTLRLKDRYSPSQTIEHLQNEYGVSQATSYRIYHKAMYVFGELDMTDLKAEKRIILEHKWNLYQQARDGKKIELANKILDEYYKMFDFSEKMALEEGELKAHQYNVIVDRGVRKFMHQQFNKGSVDFNSYPNIEDVEFKEVKDGEEEG